MSKKFDTNPLDPQFPEKARAAVAETGPAGQYTAPQSPFSTAEFPDRPSSVTEEETRRFADADFNAYWQNSGHGAMPLYQGPDFGGMNTASSRSVPKVGLPEKWLIGLPYLPFSIGLVAGLILLLIMPKSENKVRFHASQGLAAHVGILIVTSILKILSFGTGIAEVGYGIFTAVTTIMLIIFAIKAWRGKPVHIETVDDLTNWLEEKIGPIKS
ncbi:MAG: hypothetical protein ABI539_06340 [Acidobacteriota bacterium]